MNDDVLHFAVQKVNLKYYDEYIQENVVLQLQKQDKKQVFALHSRGDA